jgi:hypothetical protein
VGSVHSDNDCVFPALVNRLVTLLWLTRHDKGGIFMKKIAFATAALLALLSVAGCASGTYGKGKAPPPVVTKG